MLEVVAVLLGIAAGYAIGMLRERVKWNKLIEAGLIPRPPRK